MPMPRPVNDTVVLNLSKSDLDNAPALSSDELSSLSNSNYGEKVHSYYQQHRGGTPMSGGGAPMKGK